MTAWIGAGLLVAGFLMLIRLFKLVAIGGEVIHISRRVVGVIRSDTSDEDKEAELQAVTKRVLALLVILLVGGGVALLAPVGVLWLLDRLEWVAMDPVFEVLVSPVFIVVTSIIGLGVLFVPLRGKVDSDYSLADRCLHRIAFASTTAQIAVADVEDRIYAKSLVDCPVDRPVFVAGLPRAGTTLLLECLNELPEFGTHCYRDMPFVLTPCFWNSFSSMFKRVGQKKSRAHGDGMLIDFDSPEALEEVVWAAFWRRNYQSDRIETWSDDENEEFSDFFRSHIRKIVLLRTANPNEGRYLSKNNLNISRVAYLRRLFPDATIIIPFRDPIPHAASLLEQHRNFLQIHSKDAFARKYMQAIGHYDFGANLRPINFDGWLKDRRSTTTESLTFWLEYWIATYQHLLAQDAGLLFLAYSSLCSEPGNTLRDLAGSIGSTHKRELIASGERIHMAEPREVDTSEVAAPLLTEAKRIYRDLMQRSRNYEDSA